MSEEFHIGQRWYSHTEPELGLGIVKELINRRVLILFPATGEERTYALNNAPISRIIYPLGDRVKNDEGQEILVTEHEHHSGCVLYVGMSSDEEELIIHEASLESSVHFSKPYERLFAGQIDKLRHYELRLETLRYQHQHHSSEAYGFIGPRVEFLPHQFYIASEVGKRHAPRVLLADEVGLGKTIEAGLIIHQQIISGLAQRVLIVVPESLVHQWLVEMLRRFNLHFSVFDEQRCQQTEGNPFESEQRVLLPLSLLSRNEDYLQHAVAAGWDMMVVDEAHHLGWSEETASHAYQCVEQLAQKVKGLLLLTATPEQLGIESHFARLRLLDPDRYFDLQAFIAEEKNYALVSQLIEQLQGCCADGELITDNSFFTELACFVPEQQLAELKEVIDLQQMAVVCESIIASLLDQHGTGRVLYRNTRDSVEGFPQRQRHLYPLPFPEEYQALVEGASIEAVLHPETLFNANNGSELAWLTVDNRIEWLINWLVDFRKEKILIICAHAETAKALEKQLRLFEGIRTALFHEGMSLIERDRAAAYFAQAEEGAQLLICSEIGSEGRNFQFAHHMVMFDLPLNPDLLEQRIGRLDRIGQSQDINIHIPYFAQSAQEVLLRWYDEGVDAFSKVSPVGQSLMQVNAAELHQVMESPQGENSLELLLKETETQRVTLLDELEKGRDRLLELNSCDEEKAESLLEDVELMSQSATLSSYMSRVFDHFGVEQESTGLNGVILHPGDHMLAPHFPGLPESGLTATFQRSEALSRDDMHYLSWEHPMVSGAMEMMMEGDYGNATLCTMKLLPLKAGSLLIEAIFRVHSSQARHFQLQRYLPEACIRRVIDSSGNDLSGVITEQHFSSLGKRVNKGVALNLVKHTRAEISDLVEKLEQQVEPVESELIEQAVKSMNQQQQAEVDRLKALSEINPNIRQEEIEQLERYRVDCEDALRGASLKMDAIRVAIVTHE